MKSWAPSGSAVYALQQAFRKTMLSGAKCQYAFTNSLVIP